MTLPKRANKRREPVYMRLEKVAVLSTGEERIAFVAADPQEAAILKGRKFKPGDVIRADFSKPRNPKHHRLVMATVAFLVNSCELFETIDQALIAIKVGMGYCDPVIDGSTGRTLYIVRSISFDALDEDGFATFHKDLVRFITTRYLKDMTPEQVEEAVQLMSGTDA